MRGEPLRENYSVDALLGDHFPGAHCAHLYIRASNRIVNETDIYLPGTATSSLNWQQGSCYQVRPLPVISCVTLVNSGLYNLQPSGQESERSELNQREHLFQEPSLTASPQSTSPRAHCRSPIPAASP